MFPQNQRSKKQNRLFMTLRQPLWDSERIGKIVTGINSQVSLPIVLSRVEAVVSKNSRPNQQFYIIEIR